MQQGKVLSKLLRHIVNVLTHLDCNTPTCSKLQCLMFFDSGGCCHFKSSDGSGCFQKWLSHGTFKSVRPPQDFGLVGGQKNHDESTLESAQVQGLKKTWL